MTRQILNLTQHSASNEQLAQGVIDSQHQNMIRELLTFTKLPSKNEIQERAKGLRHYAEGFRYAMIGGAPYLMAALEAELKKWGIIPLYAFSQRVSQETSDGKKISVFKHLGFVEV